MIISGGQTGADMGGLKAAYNLGIPTGGWAPQGWKTERGAQGLLLQGYGLTEHASPEYPPRTAANVKLADATIIFGDIVHSRGSRLTHRLCVRHNKECLVIPPSLGHADAVEIIHLMLARTNPRTLNIAGSRQSKAPGIEEWVTMILTEALA